MSSEPFELSVPRHGLENALRLLRKLCRPKHGEEAVLSFDGGCLHIDCGGMAVTPMANGKWPGQIRIPAQFVMMLAKFPPPGDPVQFSVKDGRLHVGSSSVACKIQPARAKSIELPMNASLLQILALQFTHTAEEIETAGYSKLLSDAKSVAESRIAKASEHLKGLMVEPEELREFVYATLRRKIAEGRLPE